MSVQQYYNMYLSEQQIQTIIENIKIPCNFGPKQGEIVHGIIIERLSIFLKGKFPDNMTYEDVLGMTLRITDNMYDIAKRVTRI